ncbi:Uncharacterised protein [Klebsiella pneumoniae]|uniref:Uncharacterized protein n=1 Tax=Klebsiella pneumoniae TaxID=573 RepID=A0A2X3FN21_KLEPN|nr:Uncharacterised protein [Klebsiella pneumoniae]
MPSSVPTPDAHQHADHFAAQHREEDLQKALNQRGAVHTHDAADNDAADIEIEDVSGFIEFGRGFNNHVRQQTIVDQRGRNKGGADRRRTEFPQHREAFTKLAAGEAKESPGWPTITTISLGSLPPRQSRAISPPASRNSGSGTIPTFQLSIICHQRCLSVVFGVSIGSRVAENALSVVLINSALSLLFIFSVKGQRRR